MTIGKIVAALGLLGLSFFAGFISVATPPIKPRGARPVHPAPNLQMPGHSIGIVGEYFAKLNPPPPPPPPPPSPPPPPKPDIGLVFRQQVRAVVQTNGHLGVALELDGQKRVLKSGDPFEDGWFIGALNYQQVELRKGRARRQIGLFVKPNEVLSESKS